MGPVSLCNGKDEQFLGGNGMRVLGGDGTRRYCCGRNFGDSTNASFDGRCGANGGIQCPSCSRFQTKYDQAMLSEDTSGRRCCGCCNCGLFVVFFMICCALELTKVHAVEHRVEL